MAYGGGTFLTQNKILPGAYINFVSKDRASAAISDRGIAAMPLVLNWGAEGTVIRITAEEFMTDSVRLLGYGYDAEEMQPFREIFKHAAVLYTYRINSGGTKASNTYAEAKYSGTAGNSIAIRIEDATEVEGGTTQYAVYTLMYGAVVDEQIVTSAAGLKANDYVTFKTSAALAATTADSALTGGNGWGREVSDSTSEGTASEHQTALNALESCSFNTLGCAAVGNDVKNLYKEYTRRMRDEYGAKFQCVIYNCAADYEGVINVENGFNAVYWVTGASAGCAVNASLANAVYDGECDIAANYTQAQLEGFIKAGKFVFHRADNEIRVLKDINSFVSVTKDKNGDFSLNQVIRVLDQIANDVAVLFNTQYSGRVPNDKAGRFSLWGDIVKYCEKLRDIRAIDDFSDENVTVAKGEDKTAVVVNLAAAPVCAMEQLYMTVYVI